MTQEAHKGGASTVDRADSWGQEGAPAPSDVVAVGEGAGLQPRFILAPLEYGILLLLFVAILLIGVLYSGGPIFYDELRYMEIAMDPSLIAGYESQFLRLSHVYLLKLFLVFAEPMQAARLFWGFTVAVTTVLVYLNTRMLGKDTTAVHGVLAVSMFFSTAVVFQWSGTALSDLTLMMLAMVAITCYLLAHRLRRYGFLPLMGLGMVLFFAIQSKQIGIGLAVLLPGLGWAADNSFQWRRLAVRNALVLAGFALGVGILALLNAVFVGDAFFGINQRLQEFWFVFTRIFVGVRDASGIIPGVLLAPLWPKLFDLQSDMGAFSLMPGVRGWLAPLLGTKEFVGNWYTSSTYEGSWIIVFLLSLLAILKAPSHRFRTFERFIWFIPLAIIILFSLASTYMEFLGTRHYLLMFPVISMLAAQCVTMTPQELVHHRLKLVGGMAVALLVGILLLPSLEVPRFELGFDRMVFQVLYPVGLAVILVASMVPERWKHWSNLVMVVTVIAIGAPALSSIPSLMARGRTLHEAAVYPYTRFSEQLAYRDDMQLYFSATIVEGQPVLALDDAGARGMFRMVQNRDLPPMDGQFTVSYSFDFEEITEGDVVYTDILLSIRDWETLSAEQQQHLESRYTIQFDEQDASDSEIVLLSRSS